jgi:hypothetical protein
MDILGAVLVLQTNTSVIDNNAHSALVIRYLKGECESRRMGQCSASDVRSLQVCARTKCSTDCYFDPAHKSMVHVISPLHLIIERSSIGSKSTGTEV